MRAMTGNQTPLPIQRRALRVREVQAMLNLGKTKVFAMLKSGELASVRVGKARLIPVEAIDAMLKGERA